ncbi:MAG: 2-C-methyl-D-erythritol 4-phosphate cytidylyltransferase [Marinilabiliales bacterium]|nr:2-C-methyl-D-erythritol 4-phosphate cytidylyltransferase [Marinilabiliales bacterium]
MKRSVIIVAGGSGSRMGGDLPKQFMELEGLPVLMHTLQRFADFDEALELVLVLPAHQIPVWQSLCLQHRFSVPHRMTPGGETRHQSVKNGLSVIADADLVAIHDGVRPLVSPATLARCFEMAEKVPAVIPVLPVTESLREGQMGDSHPVDRSRFFSVQTPQVFHRQPLMKAYELPWEERFTDDASVFEASGGKVCLVEGNRENVKITHPEDLLVAACYVKKGRNP